MRPQLLILFRSLSSGGGAEDQVIKHYYSLVKAGYDVLVMTNNPRHPWLTQRLSSENTVSFSYRNLFKYRKRVIISYLVHDHVAGAFIAMTGAKWAPYEQTHPNYYRLISDTSLRSRLMHTLQRLLYLIFAHKIVTQTQSACDAWSQLLWGMRRSGALVIVGNIFNKPEVASHIKTEHKKSVKIVMVGRLIEVKDYSLALKVFYLMKSANSTPFSADIYGKGPLADELYK